MIPGHRRWRNRSPFLKQVLGVRLRREPVVVEPTPSRRYFLGQIAEDHVKWSHRGGRWHWRCDDTDISRTIEELVSAGWAEASGTAKSKQRHLTLTNTGRAIVEVA